MRTHKGFGLGAGQFSDESSMGLTAHNAYVLAAAEAGLVGLVLFSLALYLSLKVPVAVWLDARGGRAGRFAPAIAVSMCGALVGILFLSWSYKDVPLHRHGRLGGARLGRARGGRPRPRPPLAEGGAARAPSPRSPCSRPSTSERASTSERSTRAPSTRIAVRQPTRPGG